MLSDSFLKHDHELVLSLIVRGTYLNQRETVLLSRNRV